MQTVETPKMLNNKIKCSNDVLTNPPTENTKNKSCKYIPKHHSLQYKSAGNLLENAVDSIVKCEDILSSFSDDKRLVHVLCQLKVIKNDIGR